MSDLPRLDQVVTIKLTRGQLRRCKAAARARGLRFHVWAREAIVTIADTTPRDDDGRRRSLRLSAPELVTANTAPR